MTKKEIINKISELEQSIEDNEDRMHLTRNQSDRQALQNQINDAKAKLNYWESAL